MINLRLAFRLLWKTPFVTIVAVASLALGIGANAAIFSVFNQFLLRPLAGAAARAAGQFLRAGSQPREVRSCGQAGDCDEVFSYPMFRDLEREQTAFTGIAAHVMFGANLAARNHTLSGEGRLVSGSYFRVLGTAARPRPAARTEDDRQPGESRVAVLSYEYWQSTFGSDPSILNQTLIVNGQSLTDRRRRPRADSPEPRSDAKPQVFVPITMRGRHASGLEGLRQPAELLGLPVRAAQARASRSSRRGRASTSRTTPS